MLTTMDNIEFNLDQYFKRIGYNGTTNISLDTLRAIHHAQLYTIPFENFDIQLGRGINLEPENIFDKLVKHNRGGYCFELNGLFLLALKSIGFDVRPLLCRVHVSGTPSGKGHQMELITIEGEQWLADVGFGSNTPRQPLPLKLNQPTIFDHQEVRLTEAGDYGIMLQAKVKNEWTNLYSFDLSPVFQVDIEYGNHYTSTSPKAFFTFSRVGAFPIKGGAITLHNFSLKKTINGHEEIIELEDNATYLDALKKYFGIELDAPYEMLKKVVK